MKDLLLSNWTWWRLTRLILGVVFIISGILRYDTVLWMSGGFLIVHALFNRCSTCVNGACKVDPEINKTQGTGRYQ